MHALDGPEVRCLLEALMDAWTTASEREFELNFSCARAEGCSTQQASMAVRRGGAPVVQLRMSHDFATAETAYEGLVLNETDYLGLKRKYD